MPETLTLEPPSRGRDVKNNHVRIEPPRILEDTPDNRRSLVEEQHYVYICKVGFTHAEDDRELLHDVRESRQDVGILRQPQDLAYILLPEQRRRTRAKYDLYFRE